MRLVILFDMLSDIARKYGNVTPQEEHCKNILTKWNNEFLTRVPDTQDFIKVWYSKYAFIIIQ